jgi:uncharacterized phage protein gp47/JayE
VDASGIHAPSYQDYLAYLQDTYRSIYGADIYIEPDSQDGQLLAILAEALVDTANTSVSVYNDFSPATAQGAGLSSVVKTNGIRRQVASRSTAVVTIVGQAGTVITGAVIGDNLNLGTRWLVPLATIPLDGDVDVTVISEDVGAIAAGAGTLTNIITPVPGWQTVTNAVAAIPGAPVETDAALRRRQSRSAALPADTTLNGIYAAVANVAGVSRAEVFQNDTGVVDAEGIPARSVAVVVSGGTSADIANAIALKKPPGVSTVGNTSVTVVDSRGVPSIIRYYPLRLVGTYALVFLTALPGYVTSTGDLIKSSFAQYANDQDIGQDLYLSRTYAPVSLTGEDAQAVTGMSPAQLDALGKTFNVTGLAISDEDMYLTVAANAGATVMTVFSAIDLLIGRAIFVDLDDLSHHYALVTNRVGNDVTFTPAIPVGKLAPVQARVYVVGDVIMGFAEASAAVPDNVTIEVAP